MLRPVAGALFFCGVLMGPAHAANLKLLTPGALKSSLTVLLPKFEVATGHKVSITLTPALAVSGKLEHEAFDIAITGTAAANELERDGKLTGVTILARSGVGVFVRRGDPKPDVGSADAFIRALKNAKVITYSDPTLGGSASTYVSNLLAKLDTTGEIKAKTKLAVEYRSIANIVAAGGVDLALNQITEIRADPRLELVGPLPEPYQRYTNYAIGVVAGSANASVAKDLVAFLGSPAAVEVMKSKGFEPK